MTSQREAIRNIRREWTAETGEDPGEAAASVILDQMADAFLHLWEGAGPEIAVRRSPDTARYLATRWGGDDGKRLRDALAAAHLR